MTKRINIALIAVFVVLMLLLDIQPFGLFKAPDRIGIAAQTAVAKQPNTTLIRFGSENVFAYTPPQVTIEANDTVVWAGDFSLHPLISDDDLWQVPWGGTKFQYTFTKPGTYLFHCQLHGTAGGGGMAGTVVVR